MSWIQTYTGKKFWPLKPNHEDVCIEDIAHALSLKCRFGGHCSTFYSVAQHSVLVSQNVPPEDALWGLLHDAGEAYLPDVCRPIKSSLVGFRELEHSVMEAVARCFGLSFPEPLAIKKADTVLLATEQRDLMLSEINDWGSIRGVKPLSEKIIPESWVLAEQLFLERFKELKEISS